MALITGIVDTAFLEGATFSYLGGLLYVPMVMLAVIGFAGWTASSFVYGRAKR